ncbi:MAG: DUF6516 family protein [Anaerolineae bacterium]
MSSLVDIERLAEIAAVEFSDIVAETLIPGVNKLRIVLDDGSFMDIWYSLTLSDRYSYHWERRAIDGTIYRHDNAPHRRWEAVETFPKHFHEGSENHVLASRLSDVP